MFDDVLTVFIVAPWLAVLPAVLFYWVSRRANSRLAFYASLLWGIYLLYELAIWYKLPLACDKGCDLRVDLLVIYPLLLAVSLLVIIKLLLATYRYKSN